MFIPYFIDISLNCTFASICAVRPCNQSRRILTASGTPQYVIGYWGTKLDWVSLPYLGILNVFLLGIMV